MLNSFDEGVNERTKNNVKSLIDRFVALGNVFITFRLELKVEY